MTCSRRTVKESDFCVLIEKLQATIVVLSATNTLNIDVGALYCCVLLVATGCVEVAEAYRAVDGRVMLAVVFAFGVSSAMETSGVAGLIARKIGACETANIHIDGTIVRSDSPLRS